MFLVPNPSPESTVSEKYRYYKKKHHHHYIQFPHSNVAEDTASLWPASAAICNAVCPEASPAQNEDNMSMSYKDIIYNSKYN